MKTNKKKLTLLTLLAIAVLFTGCNSFRNPIKVILTNPDEQNQQASVSKRFTEPTLHGETAVESAVELSDKFARVSREAADLSQRNRELLTEIEILKDKLATLKPKLQQTEKELGQANEALIETTIELNNWKADVLGYREEMREASNAQLEALFKILEILGGETKTESELSKNANLSFKSAKSRNEPNETMYPGENNE